MWYKRAIENLGVEEERMLNLPEKLSKPTLMVTGLKDAVSLASVAKQTMEKLTERDKLKIVEFDTGHWIQLEKPAELNHELELFFNDDFARL